jgi:dTDP-4-dehydrorhamnose reductase
MQNNILVLGANGFIGSRICRRLSTDPRFSVNGVDKNIYPWNTDLHLYKADLTNYSVLVELLQTIKPSVIINLLAEKSLLYCQADPINAFRSNVFIAQTIVEYSLLNDIYYIFFSSDMVFGGRKGSLFKEDDYTQGNNVYGRTKIAGEGLAQLLPRHAVIRTALVFGEVQKNELQYYMDCEIMSENFTNQSLLPIQIAAFLKNKQVIYLEDDIYCSPTFVDDLSYWTHELVDSQLNGIFHFCGSERVSRNQFGLKVEQLLGVTGLVKPKSVNEIENLRPKDISLDNSRTAQGMIHKSSSLAKALQLTLQSTNWFQSR